MAQISRSLELFDAVVVGSGATGGWAAKELSEVGMKVALLEAGPKITPKDFTEHLQSWQLPYLGMSPKVRDARPIQGQCYACTEYNSTGSRILGGILLALGEDKEAFKLPNQAVAARNTLLLTLSVNPIFADYRKDPGFREILRKLSAAR